MAYNGSGVFLINSAGQPVVANTVISATVFNALTSDLATGLSTAITKDGQTTITNNIPFGSNKITGLGSGTAAADAANLGQVQSTVAKLITVTGTDTITGSMSPQLTAYAAGQLFYFVANAANTGAVTLNIDSLGAKSITRDGSSALAAGDINSGEVVVVIYDGTRFQMINAANSFGNTTINGTLTVTGNAGFQANVSITSALSVGGVFAVTGAATFTANPTLSGGTANGVLYLNGSKVATSGSALVFDGTNLGIGGSPTYRLDVFGTSPAFRLKTAAATTGFIVDQNNSDSLVSIINYENAALRFGTNATERMRIDSSGNVGIGTASPGTKLDVRGLVQFILTGAGTQTVLKLANDDTSGTSVVKAAFVSGGTTKASINAAVYGNDYMTFNVGSDTERMRLDSSGNLGLGVTPSAWSSSTAFDIGSYASVATWSNSTNIGNNFYRTSTPAFIYKNSANATLYQQTSAGSHIWYNAPSGTAGNAITFTQAMTLDASGNLSVNTTSAIAGAANRGNITIGGSAGSVLSLGTSVSAFGYLFYDTSNSSMELWNYSNSFMRFGTNDTERARITAGGDLQFATTNASPATNNVAGIVLQSAGVGQFSSDGNPGIQVNRKTNDGDLVVFRQDGTQEGSISVSGNTVSYNAFAGSHWSQLQDGSKPDILRGTVMESINELCVWPDETNERLPKSKISDTVGSKKVYGVFMAWDNGWTATNDMYVTAVGAFICRVNGSVTVQEGDLLESNGDGTARVQADDIIRSSTIGKVTSTVKTHQYDDGSYCVPTVLYCG